MAWRLAQLMVVLAVLGLSAALLTPVVESGRVVQAPAAAAPGDDSPASDDGALRQFAMLLVAAPLDDEPAPNRPGDLRPRRRPHEPVNPAEWPDQRQFRDGRARLTPELLDRCLEVAHDVDPVLGRQLAAKRDRNPEQFESVLRNHAWRVLALAQLKQRDPELYSVKVSELSQTVQVNRVAANLRAAMAENDQTLVETLKSQLRTNLQVQLAMSIKARGEYLCRLEEQLQNERETIDREARNFQATVEGRLNHYMFHVPARPNGEEADPAAELIPVSAPN